MHVRIDESRKDVFASGIDHFRPRRCRQVAFDSGNGFVFAEDISGITFAGSDYFAILDEQSHGRFIARGDLFCTRKIDDAGGVNGTNCE